MTASVPTVPPKPPGLPFALRLLFWLVVLPAALLLPDKRPTVRAILWSRWRLALVRLKMRLWRGLQGRAR
jgi:hypothetical protein